MPKKEPFTRLFEELHEADARAEDAGDALDVAQKAQRGIRQRIWDAIDASLDAQAMATDLRTEIAELRTLVIELTARLPPPPKQ